VSGANTRARREIDAQVGLVVFLGATAMLFASVLLAYAIVRAEAPHWPPAGGASFPRGAAALNTIALLAASGALHRARRGAADAARLWVRAAFGFGAAFLIAQVALWRHLVAIQLGPRAGVLGEVFFALSALHALHVLGGLVALAAGGAKRLRLLTIYWDFVLAVWAVIYVAVCVL
jgi:cytochrome c oxidase subunit III